MAVEHAFDDLFEEGTTSILIQSSSLDDIVEKFTALEEFHDNGDLHIFEGETVVDFNYVLVTKGLEYLCFDKYGVNVTYGADVLCLDGLDGEFLTCHFVDGEVYFTEPSLTQDLLQLVFTETAA